MVQSLATPQRRNMAQPDTYAVAINIFGTSHAILMFSGILSASATSCSL